MEYKIVTDAGIDEPVYVMYDNKPTKGVVKKIDIEILTAGRLCVYYTVGIIVNGKMECIRRPSLYRTKQALIKSL